MFVMAPKEEPVPGKESDGKGNEGERTEEKDDKSDENTMGTPKSAVSNRRRDSAEVQRREALEKQKREKAEVQRRYLYPHLLHASTNITLKSESHSIVTLISSHPYIYLYPYPYPYPYPNPYPHPSLMLSLPLSIYA